MAQENNYQQSSIKRTPDSPEAKADQLREDIARTRSALSEDVKALSEKLSPEHLKEDAKEVIQHASEAAREGAKHLVRDAKDAAYGSIRDAKDAAFDSIRHAKDHAFDSISYGVGQIGQRARVVGHDVSDFVGTHAVPLTLLGLGAGWLLVNISHQRRLQLQRQSYGYGAGEFYEGREGGRWVEARERAGELTSRAASALGEGSDRLREGAHEVGSRVAERVGEIRAQVTQGAAHLGHEVAALGQRAYEGTAALGHRAYEGTAAVSHRAYEGMERAGHRAVEVSEKNPLMIGLLAFGAGAAVAMLLPQTRRENALMGKTRDQLIQRAQDSASELKSSIQRGADDVREAIGELTQTGHHA